MPNYTKVQFIAWEIYSGPMHNINGDAFDYPGIKRELSDRRTDALSQCIDIDARVAFTADAIGKALQKADTSPDILKVFMGPEFLYRGSGGAYLHDLINGWGSPPPSFKNLPPPYNGPWKGLFGSLQDIVARDDFKDWVFIFGTAVSAYSQEDSVYFDAYNPGIINNIALVQRGGASNRAISYASRKHYISGIDFINYYLGATIHTNGSVFPQDPRTIIPNDAIGVLEGGAVFKLSGVNHADGNPIIFGIEICLDHASSGTIRQPDGTLVSRQYGRLKNSNQWVDIQLVPSCGMALLENSICLLPQAGDKPQSYAFNCDGLSLIDGTGRIGAHVWVRNQSATNNIQLPFNNDFDNIDPNITAVISEITLPNYGTIRADELWNSRVPNTSDAESIPLIPVTYSIPKGSGYIRAIPPLDLRSEGLIEYKDLQNSNNFWAELENLDTSN